MVITTTNSTPVAVAGTNQSVAVGTTVHLDGSASSDADHDALTYSWSLTRPASSTTTLQGAVTTTPSFFADVQGTYIAQLIVNDGFTSSEPSTVAITASLMKVTLTPNPLVLSNSPRTLTVTLSAPAGPGGVLVTFSGFDPSVISLPSSVTVPENSTGANVTVTPLAAGSTNILASAADFQAGTTSVTVATSTIGVGLSYTAVGLTRSVDGTITLGGPAPVGGVSIALTSSPVGRVTFVPPVVVIPEGVATGTFQVVGGTLGTANITADAAGYVSGSASILVVSLGAIQLAADVTVAPGQSTALAVMLSTAAPAGGVTVTLTSGDESTLTVSPSVFIAQGATQPATPAQVTGVVFGNATVSASAGGYAGDSKNVAVGGSLSFSPQVVSVGAGGDQSIQLLLSAPAPAGGLSIDLVSGNVAVATVPASVVIPAGSTASPNVAVHGVSPGNTTVTASTARPNISSASLPVTVAIYGTLSLPSGVTVGQGQSAAFAIGLSVPAPSGGTTITLSTSNGGVVDIAPKTISILAGQTQPAAQPQVTGNGLGQVTITASAAGYGAASTTVQGKTNLTFAPTTLSLAGVESKDLTLTLGAPAASALTVNLTAAPAGVVTIPASVEIAQNATTATVHVTGLAPGSATIATSTSNQYIVDGSANVVVQSAGSLILPAPLTIAPGESHTLAVTLSSPAPAGGVTVTLASGNTAKVTISPASVSIDAGATQPATQPEVTGVDFGSATITASAPGHASASLAVTVGAALTFSAPSFALVGPDSLEVTLTLSAHPPSPVLVNLSAAPNTVVTMPGTVTIAQNETTATFTIKGTSVGTATITASSATPNVVSATAGVTVQSGGAIDIPADVTVGLGQSTPLQVTLPAPAPQGGVTVTLSANPGKLTITPATVTIDAGQTHPAAAPLVTGLSPGSADVTASAPLYDSVTRAIQVTATIAFSPATLTLAGTETENLTLTLSGPAPTGGLTFNVSSSNTGAATVSSPTVTIPGGATSVGVPVSGVAPGSAVIRASAASFADATANVTVNTPVDILVPATVSLTPGDSAPFSVTLARATQSLLFLDLTSSDPAKATVSPASITIAAGQTQSATAVRVYGNATGSATITVQSTNGSLVPATSVIDVGYALTITPPNLTITGNGNSGLLTLTLSGPAPAGGVDLTLWSDNPAVATVISGVSLSPSSTSISARVTSVSAGTTVIHASGPGIPEATANVTVAPPGSISLHAPDTIGLSETGTLTITLSSPATGNGVTVELASSDEAKVSISPTTVTIPPGATTPVTQPQLTALNVGSATLTASANGYTPASPVTVQVNATIGWMSPSTTILGVGNHGLLQLKLFSIAPLAGLTVNLASSDPGIVSVQPSASIIWDGSTSPIILVQVTAVSFGTATIHASGTNIADVTTEVRVVGPVSIGTAALANGVAGVVYNASLSATGGTLPYTWGATGLPAGLQIDSVSGAIGGTPAVTGTFTVGFTVTDSSSPTAETDSRQLSLTIVPALAITTAALPNGVVGTAYNGPVAATGGTAPFTWAATGLPAGLQINAVTGVVSGTPTTAGPATIDVTVTDSTSPTHLNATRQYSVTIDGALAIGTASLPNGIVGAAYASGPLTVTGGTAPYTWGATGLPGGLQINTATGAITGTPTAAGPATIDVTVTDSTSPTHLNATRQYAVTIGAALAITTASLPNGIVGAAYASGPLTVTGGTAPYTWDATGLPGGLQINTATGAITGTPTTAGPATIDVTVTDSTSPTHLNATRQYSVTIGAALAIGTASLPNGIVGAAYASGPLSATGGTTPYTWDATGLPAGLHIDTATGAITGTPTTAGQATINVTVTDSTSPTHLNASRQYSVTISGALAISTASLPNGIEGVAYASGPLTVTGGTAPYTWDATGLPAGLHIDTATGAITGAPTAAGPATIDVTVTDSTNPTHLNATRQYSVTIGAALAIGTASLPNGIVGVAYASGPLTAAGGTAPYTWGATGLPAGLQINTATGAITGTPTTAGPATIDVTVTDSTNPTHLNASRQYSVTISGALAISTASLPNGIVGAAYASGPLTAAGGTAPYTWGATGLPAGLQINTATGAITGTPTAAGPATIDVTVTDSTNPTHLNATRQYSVTISAALAISTASLPNGIVGAAYASGPLTAAGGTAPYTWGATGLPAGLQINTATGAITGTPTTAGPATINVTVTDSTSPTHLNATRQYSVTIGGALAIGTASLPNGNVGAAYASGPLTATGGTAPYTWGATGLPAGLQINTATGAITGTPTTAGPATVDVTVTDSTNPTHLNATRQYSVTIGVALAIGTASLPNGIVGVAYASGALSATGGTAPYTWGATGLPAGLQINTATGAITGTPTTAGPATVDVTVTDSTNPTHLNATRQYSVTIGPTLSLDTTSLPQGVAQSAYSFTMSASGGTTPYTWTAPDLPAGLSIAPASGAITGTTTVAGTTTVHITVTDATNPTHLSVTQPFSLVILPALSIVTLSLPDGVEGSAYSATVTASGGTTPYTWVATGLPAPLAINASTGAIQGTPSAAGTFTVTFTATDSTGPTHQTATKDLSLTIGPALALTTASMPNGVVGSAYAAPMAASGGTQPYVWTQTGLPAGLTIDSASGAISGNPTASGPASVHVTVTDSTGPTHQSVSKTFPITIAPALAITTESLPNGVKDAAYNGQLAASGGTPPYTWGANGLPPGLSINTASGAITGTPTTLGPFTITALVTDSTNPTHQSANHAFPVTVDPAPLIITTNALTDGQVGSAYNLTALASGGTLPLHWSATGLPGGLSINAAGQITGTPTASGTSSVTLSVNDSGTPVQNAAPKTLSLTIHNLTITTTALPTGLAGVNYSYQLTATGGVAPLHWSAPALPRGMNLDPLTGLLSGVPTFPLSNLLTFSVTDSSPTPQTAAKELALTITAQPLAIATNSPLADGLVDAAYGPVALSATGGTTPYTWTSTTLPLGLTMTPDGVIGGMPTVQGTTTVTFTVTDGGSPAQHVSKQLSITINTLAVTGTISISNTTVGENLQDPITITFSPPLPTATTVNIVSSNPNLVILGTAGVTGTGAVSASLSAGTESISLYAQALGNTGQVTITASAPSYSNGTGMVTLAKAGFVIAGSAGIGGAFSTYVGLTPPLTVYVARLDAAGLFFATGQIRGGYAVSVPIASTVTTVGNVSLPSVVFSGGVTSTTLQFIATTLKANVGVTNVVVGPVSGFSQPSAGHLLVVTVLDNGLVAPSGTAIGQNLQKNLSVGRNGSTSTSAVVTIHSADSSKLVFSTAPTGATSDTIQVTIGEGQSYSPDFYAHVFGNSGTAAYSLSSPAYGSLDTSLAMAPSGLVIGTPGGDNADFTMAVGPPNATLTVKTAMLSGGVPVEFQAVAKGVSIPVTVASDNTAIGVVTLSPIAIASGSYGASTEFQSLSIGTAHITASSAGYGSATVAVTTHANNMFCQNPALTVGRFLQDSNTMIVAGGVPAGGLHMTLQSNSASLALSTDPTAAGTGSIAFDLAQGVVISPAFYIQGLGATGTATYTISAPGYTSTTCSVDLKPSGVAILPSTVFTSLGGPGATLMVLAAQLDEFNNPVITQALAGGTALQVSLTNSNAGVGSVPSPVTIAPSTDRTNILFTPAGIGSSIIGVVQPAGWSTPTTYVSSTVFVN